MLGFLQQQPYVFSLVVSVLASVLLYGWSKFTDKDPHAPNKAFFKTLTATLLVSVTLTYFVHTRGGGESAPAVLEPFDAGLPGANGL